MNSNNDVRKRATIHDVAREAGVSRGTISRYFNEDSYVSAVAREAIEQAIKKVGYVPNTAARNLVRQRTQTVAFIVHEPAALFTEDPNIGGILVGANQELSEHDYQLLTLVIDSDRDLKRVEQYLRGGFVDGSVIVSAREDDPLIRIIGQSRIPSTFIGHPANLADIPFIGIHNQAGARDATNALLAAGHTRIGMLTAGLDRDSGQDRLAGFREALGPLFNPEYLEDSGDYSFSSGFDAAARLLERAPDITAIFAASDAVAAGAADAITRTGRTLPHDISMVGFDDSIWATRMSPQLTTMHQSARSMGSEAAQCTMAQIEGRFAQFAKDRNYVAVGRALGLLLDTPLVERDSIAQVS